MMVDEREAVEGKVGEQISAARTRTAVETVGSVRKQRKQRHKHVMTQRTMLALEQVRQSLEAFGRDLRYLLCASPYRLDRFSREDIVNVLDVGLQGERQLRTSLC